MSGTGGPIGWPRPRTTSPSHTARWLGGFYAQCCFICQQAGEEALKSLALRRGAKAIFTHSLYALCTSLDLDRGVESASKRLDRYYVAARYPDALPGGAPFQLFERDEAEEALRLAQTILDAVRGA